MITAFSMTMGPINNPWDALLDKALCMLSTVQYLYNTSHHYNMYLNIMAMLWLPNYFQRNYRKITILEFHKGMIGK